MKTYIKPETKVVFVKTAHLCTLSTLGVNNEKQNNISGDSRQEHNLCFIKLIGAGRL